MSRQDERYPRIPPVLYQILFYVFKFLLTTLARYRVYNSELGKVDGPAVYVSNHLHFFDSASVGCAMPKHTRSLAGEAYEDHPFAPILRIAGAIFINRGAVDRKALKTAFNVLEDGLKLAIAVEGTRSKTGMMARGKTGAAYIATRANVPLVPVAVWGTEKVVPAWKKLRRAQINVVFGEPFRLPEGRARTDQLEAYTDEIMVRIAKLMPEEYHGYYKDHPLMASLESAQSPEK